MIIDRADLVVAANRSKYQRTDVRDGSISVPTLYDTDIYVPKVRFKSVGKFGVASLGYERSTGRYFEVPQTPSDASKSYRNG